jgi:hypothetical protein
MRVPAINAGGKQMQSQDLLSELRTLEVATYQACIRGDGIRLGELLHPGFREFGRSGQTYSRADLIDAYAGQAQDYEVRSDEFHSELLAKGLALLTYRSAQVSSDGTVGRYTLRASLWEQTEVGWQMRFHQGTPTEPPCGQRQS